VSTNDSPDGGRSSAASRTSKRGGGHDTGCSLPWAGTDREGDKTRLFTYARESPEGVRLSKAVADVLGDESGEYVSRDYQLARRFYDRQDCVKTTRRDGGLWVEPTTKAFHLTPPYAKPKKTRGRGDGAVTGETSPKTRGEVTESPEVTADRTADDRDDVEGNGGDSMADGRAGDKRAAAGGDGRGDRPAWAKGRARRYLEGHVRVGADSTRRSLLDELVTDREATEDKYNVFERVRGTGEDYLLVPWTTRYNDEARAHRIRDRFSETLREASARHGRAVCLTLTTDPKRYDSLTGALSDLTDAKGRLMSWLSYDPKGGDAPARPGYRPDNLTALEFTESGLPHLHVVLFGVRWATSQAALSRYWDESGTGEVVDIRPVRRRGDRWLLREGTAATGNGGDVSLRRYLGKSVRSLCELAGADADELRARVEDGDLTLWRQALYWATGKRYWTATPDLTPDDPDDGGDSEDLPHVPVWRHVGAARYHDLPGHVRRNARLLLRDGGGGRPRRGPVPPDRTDVEDRPPPGEGGATGGTTAGT